MSTPLIIIGMLLLSAAITLTFKPYVPAAVVSYAALWLLSRGGLVTLSQGSMLYWGIATVLVVTIDMMRRGEQPADKRGHTYMCAGIISGMTVGLLLDRGAGCIAGGAIGAMLGILAYSRTPAGRRRHCQLTLRAAADALPALVSLCQTGPVLQSLLAHHIPQ